MNATQLVPRRLIEPVRLFQLEVLLEGRDVRLEVVPGVPQVVKALLRTLVGILSVGFVVVQVQQGLEREVRRIIRQLVRIRWMAPRKATAARDADVVLPRGPVASCRACPNVSAELELVGRSRDGLAVLIDELNDDRLELVGGILFLR